MIRALAVIELCLGVLAAAGVIALFADGPFCWFGGPGCGMWAPLFAVYEAPIAISLIVAGILHRKRMNKTAAVAYVPAILTIIVQVGQAENWW